MKLTEYFSRFDIFELISVWDFMVLKITILFQVIFIFHYCDLAFSIYLLTDCGVLVQYFTDHFIFFLCNSIWTNISKPSIHCLLVLVLFLYVSHLKYAIALFKFFF